jgi:hypothetical protein
LTEKKKKKHRGITRDESMYPDPEAFNPGRWLDPSFPTYREPLTQYPNLNGYSQFGFGRRTCQGIPIVEQDLFLSMGGMAWAFDIRKKRDPDTGAEIPVHWNDYTPLLIAKPVRFPFDAIPRSPEKVVLMRDMYESARNEPVLGPDLDISQFEPDLGDQIYIDDVAAAFNNESDANSVSSDRDAVIHVVESSPEPDLAFSDSSYSEPSEGSESDRERERMRLTMMGVPPLDLDPGSLGLKAGGNDKADPLMPMLAVPGAWNWA